MKKNFCICFAKEDYIPLVKIKKNLKEITFDIPKKNVNDFSLEKSRIEYNNLLPKIDVFFEVKDEGFSEQFIIKNDICENLLTDIYTELKVRKNIRGQITFSSGFHRLFCLNRPYFCDEKGHKYFLRYQLIHQEYGHSWKIQIPPKLQEKIKNTPFIIVIEGY